MSVDRLLYVCDRAGDRLQVFTPDGKFVKEGFFDKNTKASGSVWDIAFSKDPKQAHIFMADGMNDKVHVIDRQTLQELTTFGDGGLDVVVDRAWLDHAHQVVRIDLQDPVHSRQIEDDAAADRVGAAW